MKADDIKKLCETVSKRLSHVVMGKEQIMFPYKYDNRGKPNDVRISEQEARFLFASEIEKDKNFHYAVETPTEKRYRFGKKMDELSMNEGQSASYDLTLHDKKEGQFNIEFKALNPGEVTIAKDFLKLFTSNFDGLFFHVLKNTDRGTIKNISEKYRQVIEKMKKFRIGKGEIYFWIFSLEYSKGKFGTPKYYFSNGCDKRDLIQEGFKDIELEPFDYRKRTKSVGRF